MSIKTFKGYLRAEPGVFSMVNEQWFIGPWEKWNFDLQGDGTFCVRNHEHNTYIRTYS
jgi:hypothetical protein